MTTDRITNLVSLDQRTRWQRLMSNAFPRNNLPIPAEDDKPGFAPSYLLTYVEARLDWLDRLRILVSGKCEVQIRTYTDVAVKKSVSESLFTVLAP